MTQPRTLGTEEREYKNMVAVAKLLEATSKNGYRYEVEDCYFDHGQDWMWTTIICHNDFETGMFKSWQAINPREWGTIIYTDTVKGLASIAEEIKQGKYFQDK